jgi:hypothetical protein
MKSEKSLIFLILLLALFSLFEEESFPKNRFSKKDNPVWYRGYHPSQEIVSARTLNSKVFKTENGRLVFRIFLCPVHYIDENGMLEDMVDSCFSCFDWEIEESYSGFVDGLFEDKSVCGINTDYISVNDTYLYRGFVEFNTEIIPDTTIIDRVELNLNCAQWPVYNEDHDIWSIENRPSISSAIAIYNDAADGNCYISNYIGDIGWNSWDIGEEACQDMEDLLQEDWFAIGISGWSSASAYHLLYQCGTGWIDVMKPIGVEEGYEKGAPGQILLTNYPNPFSTKTEISFSIGHRAERIELEIFDLTGRCIKNFPIPDFQFPIRIEWDGTDDKGNIVPNGTYFYQLNLGNKYVTKSMTLIR